MTLAFRVKPCTGGLCLQFDDAVFLAGLRCGDGDFLRGDAVVDRDGRRAIRAQVLDEILKLRDVRVLEALVETPLNPAAVKPEHADPARWYSVARAQAMPTTLILKARKPLAQPLQP